MNATEALRSFADAVQAIADIDPDSGRDMQRALDRIEDTFAVLRALFPRETVEVLCPRCHGDENRVCGACQGDRTILMVPAPDYMQTRRKVREMVAKTRRAPEGENT